MQRNLLKYYYKKKTTIFTKQLFTRNYTASQSQVRNFVIVCCQWVFKIGVWLFFKSTSTSNWFRCFVFI